MRYIRCKRIFLVLGVRLAFLLKFLLSEILGFVVFKCWFGVGIMFLDKLIIALIHS